MSKQNVLDCLNRKLDELYYANLLHDSIKESSWLIKQDFSLFGGAANYSFIYILFTVLNKTSPLNILEFGLGQTTKVTSQYIINKNPSAKLNICEHNKDWIDIYTLELPINENIKINYCELEYFDYEEKQNDKYKGLNQIVLNQKFDLIIVDGPIGVRKNLPRSNILDLIENDNLSDDFIIIFDDAEREGEQLTIAKTKELLESKNTQYVEFKRNALKTQHIITSLSKSFFKYL